MSSDAERPDIQSKPNFHIGKAAAEAGRVMAEAHGLHEVTEIVTVVRMQKGADFNVSSLSTLDPDDHLQALAEATQAFAAQVGTPLQVIFMHTEEGGAG